MRVIALGIFLVSFLPPRPVKHPYKLSGHAQGTTWHITYYAADSIISNAEIDSILTSLDSSLSIYLPSSLISRFNLSDSGIVMDHHLQLVMQRSIAIYQATKGISDPTVYPLVNAWGFGPEKPDAEPDSQKIRSILPCVGADRIHIDGDRLVKDKPCVRLDLNGIAQGYSVDVVAAYLESKKLTDFLVEIGGEIVLKGRRQPDGAPLTVAIDAPSADPFGLTPYYTILTPGHGGITTSGNYRKFRESGGRTVSHLIDPHSGYPFSNNLLSVTVWAKDGMTADGYDNALMGMGLEKALVFLTGHPELQAFLIYRDQHGSVRSRATPGFKKIVRR